MKTKKLFFIGLFNISLLGIYGQTTITLQPDPTNGKDAFIYELQPTNNFANHPDFIAFDWTFSGTESLGKSLIQFDLSAIPASSIITEAKISLFYNPTTSSGGQAGINACYLKKITSTWQENTVTWNTTPSTTIVDQVSLATSTSSNQDYPNIDITDLAKDWYANPSVNYGLMLELINNTLYNSMKFCSSDYSDPLKRPKLVITYIDSYDSCITIQPGTVTGKDAFIYELQPTNNFANHPDFIAFDWTFSGTESFGKSLIQFGLPVLPANSVVSEAKLSLFYNPTTSSGGQAGTNACFLKKITSPWQENTVTWNTAPSATTAGEIYLETSTSSNQDYPNIDITYLVKDWYSNPSINYGLMLELVNNTLYNSMKFCSSDYSDSTKSPKLVICYNIPNDIKNMKDNSTNILIYPNPVKDKITIELSLIIEKHTFTLFNINGQELMRKEIENVKSQIDISNLASGIYFVKVANGKTVEVKKIIKG